MKRFAVFPGEVTSINDWQRHYITAPMLMRLYGVHPRECVVFQNSEDWRGWRREDIDRLLHLTPLTSGIYRKVSDREREIYPLPPSTTSQPGSRT